MRVDSFGRRAAATSVPASQTVEAPPGRSRGPPEGAVKGATRPSSRTHSAPSSVLPTTVKRWQKILVGVGGVAYVIYDYRNAFVWVVAIFVAGSLAYNHLQPNRPTRAERTAVRADKEAKRPTRRLLRRTLTALAWLLGVTMILAVVWALPYFIAAATLGEVCPWTPPGITDPAWKCGGSGGSTPTAALETQVHPGFVGTERCKREGIRYAGTTAEGAKVCFTLTPDRGAWLEIVFSFVRASGCPQIATGTASLEGPTQLDAPGRIEIPGSFTATIRVASASGVLEDSHICGSKQFEWSAHRAS